MFKGISNLGKVLNKTEQQSIMGASIFHGEPGQCPPSNPNSFFCGFDDHICCNGLCVLPSHPACGLV